MPSPDVQVAKIDQRVGDGMGVLSRALDVQDFPIAALGRSEILDPAQVLPRLPRELESSC